MSDRINECGRPASEILGKEKTEEDKLNDKIQELEATIKALKGMMGQLIPVVDVFLPHLKKIPEMNKESLAQVERMIQVAKMLSAEDAGDVLKNIPQL